MEVLPLIAKPIISELLEQRGLLEFLVQELPSRIFIGEPPGRMNDGRNQFFYTVHQGNSFVEEGIVTGVESAGNIYLTKYPTALMLPNLVRGNMQKLMIYLSGRTEQPKVKEASK